MLIVNYEECTDNVISYQFHVESCSKGLGHAILGNFSIDQMVIELTEKNKITAQNYRTQTKHKKAKKGQGWTKLGRIEKDCIWVNLKNVGPPFFKFISVFSIISELNKVSCNLIGRAVPYMTLYKLLQAVYITFPRPGYLARHLCHLGK